MKTNSVRPQAITVPFFKRASFAYSLLGTFIILFTGIYLGWMLRSENIGQVHAEAASLASSVSKADK